MEAGPAIGPNGKRINDLAVQGQFAAIFADLSPVTGSEDAITVTKMRKYVLDFRFDFYFIFKGGWGGVGTEKADRIWI